MNINPSKSAVIVFSKEQCKYCTLSKDLFKRYKIPYHEVKLDPSDSMYKEHRNKLIGMSKGHSTFPWIFTGEKFLGGFSELRHSVSTGSICRHLEKIGIKCEIDDDF